MVKDQFMPMWKGLTLAGPWASLIFVFVLWGALLYMLVLAAILLLCLVASSTSSHLSLFSYTVRNNCPKLVQGCNHPSPRVNYALDNFKSKSPVHVSSWKLILSFRIFDLKCYKCPLQKLVSNMPPDSLYHQGFLFSFTVFFFSFPLLL